MQQATTVSLQMGFSGPPEGYPISPNLIEIKEERVEGLGGFEPATCGLGNQGAQKRRANLSPSMQIKTHTRYVFRYIAC